MTYARGRWSTAIVALTLTAAVGACGGHGDAGEPPRRGAPGGPVETATFAAGCFWSVETDFDALPGVVSTISGYTGGRTVDPSYREVLSGGTGHAEAVQVTYDPRVVSYGDLLEHYWRHVDPFVAHRQFCDVGDQYRPEIFVHDAAQRAAADASRARVQAQFPDPVVVRVTDASAFYPAEAAHQDYARKNPLRYKYYRWACGRDRRVAAIWGAAPGGTRTVSSR